MCGFTGIINRDRALIHAEVLDEMAATIKHRGPDDYGTFIHENVGLAFQRLSIIDLDSGHQPMTRDGVTVVFNGEIYNYIELRDGLKKRGHKFRTTSDTEVLLAMYTEYGRGMLEQLNGMFAFLLFDEKEHKLFGARDHFGIKPLYYYVNSRLLLFASEIKALLAHPEVVAEVNQEGVQDYLTFQFTMGGHTLFRDIYKVLPGSWFEVDLVNNTMRQQSYWEPDFTVDRYHTEAYFTDTLRDLLEDTIQKQLRSDVPVGTYLSGGMDSSLVTVLSSRYAHYQIQSFTGGFKEGNAFDETGYAREAAGFSGANLLAVYPVEDDFIENLPRLIYHMDEPGAGPGLFPQYMVSKKASEHVKVMLGGQGGDEIFGGYARYVVAYLEQAIKGAIFESNEEGEHIVSLNSILPNLPYIRKYIPMMKDFWRRGAFEEMDKRYFHLLDRSGAHGQIFDRGYLEQFDKRNVYRRFQRIFNHSDTLSYYNKMTHFDMFGSLPALLQVEDRVSMAVSIESRVPLLDRRIVDLVSRMPAVMKFKGAEMKYLLKKAIRDVMPPVIMDRKDKMGFPVPLQMWMKGRTGDFIREILLSQRTRDRGIFDTDSLKNLIDSERPFGRGIWGAISLELWYRTFIDNQNKTKEYDDQFVLRSMDR